MEVEVFDCSNGPPSDAEPPNEAYKAHPPSNSYQQPTQQQHTNIKDTWEDSKDTKEVSGVAESDGTKAYTVNDPASSSVGSNQSSIMDGMDGRSARVATTDVAHGAASSSSNSKGQQIQPKEHAPRRPARNGTSDMSNGVDVDNTIVSSSLLSDTGKKSASSSVDDGAPAGVQPSSSIRTRRETRRTSLESADVPSPPSTSNLGDGDAAGGPTLENGLAASRTGDAGAKHQRSRRARRSAESSYSPQFDQISARAGGMAKSPRRNNDVPTSNAMRGVVESDVMILSCLDDRSYQRALLKDSNTYLNNILFPMNFPWHNATEPLPKTIPKDIDELHGVVYAGNDDASIRESREGPVPDLFGYGKCEIGQERQQGMIPSFAMGGYNKVVAATRRANDPGQIELAATMPAPPSLDAVLVSYYQCVAGASDTCIEKADSDTIQRLKATVESERAEAASSMPMYCRNVDGDSYFNPPAFHPDVGSNKGGTDDDDSDDGSSSGYSDMYTRDRLLQNRKELAKACARKWKVSIKVGGTSSRSRIFTSATPPQGKAKSRPMLRTATLPTTILSGQSVTADVAMKMDKVGLAARLGSYDCRFAQASASSSKDKAPSSSSKKKVSVGRTRLIWTRKNEKSEGASKYGKSTYTSVILGQKVDANTHKRPREVRVGVRINGQLLSEEMRDNSDAENPSVAAGKKSSGRKTKQADNVDSFIPSSVPASDSRSNGEIDRAINAVSVERQSSTKKRKEATCAYPPSPVPIAVAEPTTLVASVVSQIKRSQKGGGKRSVGKIDAHITGTGKDDKSPQLETLEDDSAQYVSMKHGASLALKHIGPRFALLPLDDGLLRTVCVAPGTMQAASVHNMLHAAAKKENGEKICSVCWTNDGSTDKTRAQECIDCGLFVHLDCCESKGEFVPSFTRQGSAATGGADSTTSTSYNALVELCWRCAICKDSSRMAKETTDDSEVEPSIAAKKPRRAAKLPSRFCDGQTSVSIPTSNRAAYNRPSPKCSLCPHSGGAMSMLGKAAGDPAQDESERWTHEICRIWCQAEVVSGSRCTAAASDFAFENPKSNVVCVLCGIGGNFHTEEENSGGIDGLSPGVVKCAAKGCYTAFHPMCATLATKMLARPVIHHSTGSTELSRPTGGSRTRDRKTRKRIPNNTAGQDDLDEKKARDMYLCKKYTLTLVEMEKGEGADDFVNAAPVVPVAFCGLHNPEREDELYGCLPEGVIGKSGL